MQLLDLSDTEMEDGAGASIAESLLLNTSLAILDVSRNSVGDNAGRAIAEVPTECTDARANRLGLAACMPCLHAHIYLSAFSYVYLHMEHTYQA